MEVFLVNSPCLLLWVNVQMEKVLSRQKLAFAEDEFCTKHYQVFFEVFHHMGYIHPINKLQYLRICGVQIKQDISNQLRN